MLQFKPTMIHHRVVQTTPPEIYCALCTLALRVLAAECFQRIIKSTVSITEQFLPTQLQCPQRQHGQLCDGCRVKYTPWPELCPSATLCTRSIFQDDLMRSTPFEHCICEGQTQDLQRYSLESQTLSLPEQWNWCKIHIASLFSSMTKYILPAWVILSMYSLSNAKSRTVGGKNISLRQKEFIQDDVKKGHFYFKFSISSTPPYFLKWMDRRVKKVAWD